MTKHGTWELIDSKGKILERGTTKVSETSYGFETLFDRLVTVRQGWAIKTSLDTDHDKP